ncbi:MAG TPA: AHH domain-containing protein [Cellvibrionaceae bacterium]|nr:AHH domain-containing protein [Cellvibrionaceae bacterium]
MTDIGEAIAVIVATPDSDEPCWACKKEPETQLQNNLNESPSSIGEPENQLHNDSSELGKSLGFRPTWTIQVAESAAPGAEPISAEVTAAAHHLIPGNASLKKCPQILDLIEASRDKIRSDIGYNVNSEQNGVWLPGSYGVNPDSVFKKKWSAFTNQQEYAFKAMDRANAQFHDAHPEYSRQVIRALRSLADKITLTAPEKCGICGEKTEDKARPPYGLVGRLNQISSMHRRFLRGPMRKWPIQSGYFTSRWSGLRKNSL